MSDIHSVLSWFDTPYYNLLYQHRNDDEAQFFIKQLDDKNFLKPHFSLLDVGCGNGRFAFEFLNYVQHVVGVDQSPNKIKEAQEKEHPRAHFLVHDMHNPIKLNKMFDIVFNGFTSFGYHVDEHFNNVFFKNMCAPLHQNGLFIFDYINAAAAQHQVTTPQQKHIFEHLELTITKHQDDAFFFKKIDVYDTASASKKTYYERVKKYKFEDIVHKFKANGLTLKAMFGNYRLDDFNSSYSPRMIMIGERHDGHS